MEDDEAPLPVRLHALAAQDTKAGEEELDRHSENKQPGKPDENLARYIALALRRPNDLDSSLATVTDPASIHKAGMAHPVVKAGCAIPALWMLAGSVTVARGESRGQCM